MERDDWAQGVRDHDAVLWRPIYYGPGSATVLKEKVFFMEHFLGIRVVPNVRTLWHYDSKAAQTYMFRECGVRVPSTVVTSSHHDAMEHLTGSDLPLVFKASHGASSSNVRLIRTREKAKQAIDSLLCAQRWRDFRRSADSRREALLRALSCLPWQRWFWSKVRQRLLIEDYFDLVYWQEFVPGNDGDLRITVIGDRFAVGFWRKNRPGDFRASGSGLLDYDSPVPEAAVRYCIDLNRRFAFDSMAYDLLFAGDDFVVVEMSYAYVDRAVFDAPGHYRMVGHSLDFVPGHVEPQQLWVDWLLLELFGDAAETWLTAANAGVTKPES